MQFNINLPAPARLLCMITLAFAMVISPVFGQESEEKNMFEGFEPPSEHVVTAVDTGKRVVYSGVANYYLGGSAQVVDQDNRAILISQIRPGHSISVSVTRFFEEPVRGKPTYYVDKIVVYLDRDILES